MKKNNLGFTLIELLAVITIMGILLLVAIPAVTSAIENSRRDTFVTVSKQYIETVRNAVMADELKCGEGAAAVNVAATGDGVYYIHIKMAKESGSGDADAQNTADLMEKGGLSPWGSAELEGYVMWTKEDNKIEYKVQLADTGHHGLAEAHSEKALKRSAVLTSGVNAVDKPTSSSGSGESGESGDSGGSSTGKTPIKCVLDR